MRAFLILLVLACPVDNARVVCNRLLCKTFRYYFGQLGGQVCMETALSLERTNNHTCGEKCIEIVSRCDSLLMDKYTDNCKSVRLCEARLLFLCSIVNNHTVAHKRSCPYPNGKSIWRTIWDFISG